MSESTRPTRSASTGAIDAVRQIHAFQRHVAIGDWDQVGKDADRLSADGRKALATEMRTGARLVDRSAELDAMARGLLAARAKLVRAGTLQQALDAFDSQQKGRASTDTFYQGVYECLRTGASAGLYRVLRGAAPLPGLHRLLASRMATLSMLATGLQGSFWASFNAAAAGKPLGRRDLATGVTRLRNLVDGCRAELQDGELAVFTGAVTGDHARLMDACGAHAAATAALSAEFAPLLGVLVPGVTGTPAGRPAGAADDSWDLLLLAMGLVRRCWAGSGAAYYLTLPPQVIAALPKVAEALKSAAQSAPYRPSAEFRTATVRTLPRYVGKDTRLELRGVVTSMTAQRRGHKLLSFADLSDASHRGAGRLMVEFHDLRHEGLTVGACVSARGVAVIDNEQPVLRVGRPTVMDPEVAGWVSHWLGSMSSWAPLNPAGLDMEWTPGIARPMVDGSDADGVGAGELLYNKPMPQRKENPYV